MLTGRELECNSTKPVILYIPPDNYEKALDFIKDKNVLGITSSRQRAREAKKKFGGECLHQDISVKEVEVKARTQKGLLVWDYIDSPTSRGTNRLHFFDGFITYNPKNIDPAHEIDDSIYVKKKAEEVYQHGSGVFRTVNGKKLKKFGIIIDREIFEVLKDMISDWEFQRNQTS